MDLIHRISVFVALYQQMPGDEGSDWVSREKTLNQYPSDSSYSFILKIYICKLLISAYALIHLTVLVTI